MSSILSGAGDNVCTRPGCNNVLTGHQKKYCSNACAAQDRARVRAMSLATEHISTEIRDHVSPEMIDFAVEKLGSHAGVLFQELTVALQEGSIAPPPPRELTTIGDTRYGIFEYNGQFYRPDTALSYTVVEDMLKNGAIQFALAIKQSSIHSVLRNDRSWQVECEDERIKSIVYGMARQIFRDYANEMLLYMPYGAMFFEKQWSKLEPVSRWGIEGARGKAYGYEKLASCNPATIAYINYDGKHFDGFTQQTHKGEVRVPAEYALVLSYNQRFRNLWGNSILDPVYPYWFWLEVSTRAFMRYLERMGTPVTIVYAPSQRKITVGTQAYNSMDYALLQAAYIAKSNAAAFPSDVHPETNHKLWEVQYLEPSQRGDQFVSAIEHMSTMIMRSMIIADRAATAGGEVGSYAMSQTHFGVSQLHNQLVLDDFISQINRYIVEPIVRYNGRRSTPPASIVVEGLDEGARERLFQLISIAGNQAGDAQPLGRVDWERLYELTGIPALTQEEIDEIVDAKLEKDVHKQEVLAKSQAKMAEQNPQNTGFQQKPAQGPTKKKEADRVKQSAEYAQVELEGGLSCGQVVPFLVTDEQAEDWLDRLSSRGRVFVFENKPEPSLDEMVEQILQQVLADDGESPTEEEIEEVRRAIHDYLTGDLQELEEVPEGYIELSVGSFLKRAWSKIKSVANKAVKAVSGRDIGQWRRGEKPEKKYRVNDVETVITKDGRAWREKDHPRDRNGKFSSSPGSGGGNSGDKNDHARAIPETGLTTSGSLTDGERDLKSKITWNGVPPEKQDEITKELHSALQNSYLFEHVDPTKFVFLGEEEWKEISTDPILGGLYNPEKDRCYVPVYGFMGIEKDIDTIIHNAVHEGVHGIGGSTAIEDRRLGNTQWEISAEEAFTELLTLRSTKDPLNESAYRQETNMYVDLLRQVHGDNKSKIWTDIERLHSGGSQREEILQAIKVAYPDLTRNQMKVVLENFDYSKHDPWGERQMTGALIVAYQFHAQNTYGSDWEKYFEQWKKFSVVPMSPIGYAGNSVGANVEWLFNE